MTELTQETCTPCEEGGQPLEGEELQEYLQKVPQWDLEDNRIRRTFKFDDFSGALEFTQRVGQLAEQQQHHPDIHLGYGKVTVELQTHKIGGLSPNDFILAAKIDELRG